MLVLGALLSCFVPNSSSLPIQPGFQPQLQPNNQLEEASGTQPFDSLAEEDNQQYDEMEEGVTLEETLLVDNIKRSSLVYLPCGYHSEKVKNRPLVIVLHGARLSGKIAKSVTRFDNLACKKDFVVAYPDALNKQWNDGRRRGDTPSYGVDDTIFILRLAELISYKYSTDPKRVYLVGYSSGGMLAQKVVIEASPKIAGIGIVAATMPEKIYKLRMSPKYPMPVVIIMGTKDHAFPWEGGDTKILGVKVGPVVSVDKLLDFWLSANGGQAQLIGHETDLKDVDVSTYITKKNVPVALYTVNNGGHTWPGGRLPFTYIPFLGKQIKSLNAAEVIWEMLSPYARTEDITISRNSKKFKKTPTNRLINQK